MRREFASAFAMASGCYSSRSKKSALVRDVESGVGGRRGDAGKDAWERNFRRVAVRELAVLFRPGVGKILREL